MHNDITNEEILKRYNSLPADLKEAMSSDENTGRITAIGKKHSLMIDKIGELADETGLVMLGITPPGEYVRNLAGKLGVDREKARAIAEDINLEIFRPIRESLKKVHNIKEVRKAGEAEPEGEIIRPDIVMPEKIEKPEIPSLFAKKIPLGEMGVEKTPPGRTLGVWSPSTPSVEERGGAPDVAAKTEPLGHEEVKAAVEKSLGGEIRTAAPTPAPQPAKKYIGQDPYQEQI